MANPNIVNVTDIRGKTTYSTPNSANATVLVANSASSNKIFKINSLLVTNINGTTARDATVAINTAANGSGNGYPIASTIAVPADSTLVIISKENSIYLEEDKSIVVTSGVANDLTFVVSYEEIS
jgi:20S proteasome alpha/beta subunit